MKFIIQQGKNTISRNIQEHELDTLLLYIINDLDGIRIDPLPYEIARFKIPHGVAVIFQDNKKLRTRNYWYEVRGLAVLSKELGLEFYHSVPMKFQDGQSTEIDGLDVESERTMIELKQTTITQKWIDFYEYKRKRLGLQTCVICAPRFETNLEIPPKIQVYKVRLDNGTVLKYYEEDFELPNWFEPFIPSRHVRVLLGSGNWYGIKRKLTKTAKHTPTSKIKQSILYLFRQGQLPVRIYYSLASMLIPQRDYYGRGYPQPRIIAAFDVDSDHKPHVIGKEGFCLKCLEEAAVKRDILTEKLVDLGWSVRVIHSGFKGYHVYCIEEGKNLKELDVEQIQNLIIKLKDDEGVALTDNENFRSKDGSFDLHRIFKLPNTIDAVTGMRVINKLERIKFNDQITSINPK
ncbi:MAG: hypothetical protein JW891_05800 [Candidatus Lokiarchaeota archaeon]|nr:hypothetical protein [Candidatus Lokiarchaeota archaeon]